MKSPTSVLGLDAAARGLGKKLPVYLEVKLSHEESKHGMQPAELPELLQAIAGSEPRPYFQQLRQLRDENVGRYPMLTGLSMGISNDFAAAVEEGSTCVLIGTAIFGKRQPAPPSAGDAE